MDESLRIGCVPLYYQRLFAVNLVSKLVDEVGVPVSATSGRYLHILNGHRIRDGEGLVGVQAQDFANKILITDFYFAEID